ncbi:MAG TPA: DNA recombination protein RmuC [Gammaproteobacteria bacterium]|nr:DNA recombination protein RmuC [Gammaproteobacteria bacterium]
MIQNISLFSAILIALLAALAGAGLVYLRLHKRIASLTEQNSTLNTTLDMERRAQAEKLAALENAQEQARSQLTEAFSHLSRQALKHNNEEFLKLAQENLKQFQARAQGELSQKEQAIENLVKPIKEALEKTEKQIRSMEHERKQAYGALTQHLETMAQTQQALQGETRNLVKALSRPEVRGQWGEMTLKRLAELAGMVEHCDFFEQEHTQTADGALRPDMIVRMPGGREIVVDVKTPLDAYLSAVEATDEQERETHLARHTKNVRKRVQELATKGYWNQFKNAPDFVVLFIPGDQFLSAALDNDYSLLEDAMQQKVILATPTSFVALLRAVAYGWRQESLTENAEHIREVGEELYGRLATFAEHLGKLGRNLNSSVQHYNKAASSFNTRVEPGARKFSEMGISSKKAVDPIEQIETAARDIEVFNQETDSVPGLATETPNDDAKH